LIKTIEDFRENIDKFLLIIVTSPPPPLLPERSERKFGFCVYNPHPKYLPPSLIGSNLPAANVLAWVLGG
jgi:hypothetical protein